MYLNRFTGIGYASSDPEIREPQGKKNASFRIGITEKYKDASGQYQEKTEWVNVVAWGRTADVVEKIVTKGATVYVEGKVQTRQWEDRQGNKRYVTEINASNVQVDKPRAHKPSERQQYTDDDIDF